MLMKHQFWSTALGEYLVGLYASGWIGRIARPMLGLLWLAGIVIGFFDMFSGWTLPIPTFVRIGAMFAIGFSSLILWMGHVRRMRRIGREHLDREHEANVAHESIY